MHADNNSYRPIFAAVLLAGMLAAGGAWGQTFSSGSTGADGDLIFPAPQNPPQTIIFDPTTLPNPLAAGHGPIYNFGVITIPKGLTVTLSAQNLGSSPQYWLATGAVDIEGTLSLSGTAGYPSTNLVSQRIPSIPGPGGFPGGVGGSGGTGSPYPVEPGQGPGGGGLCYSGNYGSGGAFTANQFLVPLIGGSGGAGSDANASFGGGGGAGGGAILIASSVSTTINGVITAAGGSGGNYYAGGGAGGAVRLVAPTIEGNGTINVAAGSNAECSPAQNGLARLEAFNQLFSGSISGNQASGTPYNTFVPSANTTPQLTVYSVNNVLVTPIPLGNFTNPDVTFSASGAVPVVINGANIPPGTQVSLDIYSENGPDIIVPASSSTALAGSLASSTVTVPVNLPPGFSRGFISASFSSLGGSPNVRPHK